jgi:hypothetical protein
LYNLTVLLGKFGIFLILNLAEKVLCRARDSVNVPWSVRVLGYVKLGEVR